MLSIFHGLLLLWMNYSPFMMHIRCIILYAVKLDFYGAVAFHPPIFSFLPQPTKEIINPELLILDHLHSLRKVLLLTSVLRLISRLNDV